LPLICLQIDDARECFIRDKLNPLTKSILKSGMKATAVINLTRSLACFLISFASAICNFSKREVELMIELLLYHKRSTSQ
jgi:hypothetical protein